MGSYFFRSFKSLFGKREVRMTMVGLDGAGKTTIMYKIKLNDTIKTLPTIGFNVETMEYKGLKLTMWDIGGQDKIRELWRHYYCNNDAIIFVIDSNDKERLELAKEEIYKMLNEEELKGLPILIYANKQDISDCFSINEIIKELELNSIKDRKWNVQGATAIDGRGLSEGLDWLAAVLKDKKQEYKKNTNKYNIYV